MEFNSLFFILIFMPLFIGLMFFIKNNQTRNIIILISSIFFYSLGDFKHLLVLLLIFLITYLFSFRVKNNKKLYILYLIIIVSILSYFKYGSYLINNLKDYFKTLDFIKIIMPLGISFYTFTSISYVSDIYYEKYEYEKNPLNILTYLSFFPVVISGPLIRYDDFKKYLIQKNINIDNISNGFRRFIIGLAKKVIIANQLNIITTVIINNNVKMSFILALYGIIAFGIQMYYDFSGYSDMAIGVGKMIGFKINENFNDPYFSSSIREFWQRWHISLGTWLKDYIYIPLGGNRKGLFRKGLNTLIVFMISGLWHGTTLNYLLWGLINGLFIACSHWTSNYKKIKELLKINEDSKIWKAFKIIRTSTIVFLLWAFVFKCTNNDEMINLFKALTFNGARFSLSYIKSLDVLYLFIYLLIGFIFLFPSIHKLFKKLNKNIYDICLLCLLIISIFFIVSGSYSAFIYFNF